MQIGTKNASWREPEWQYLGAVLSEFLGLPTHVEDCSDISDIRLSFSSGPGEIRLPNNLLAKSDDEWLTLDSLPQTPLSTFEVRHFGIQAPLVGSQLPVLYPAQVESGPLYQEQESPNTKSISINFDLMGGIFFMLSRYEELIKQDRDRHDRFPATASLAHQEGFLTRPIVNEYVELLWACMKKLWPNLQRKSRDFRVQVSHDVDHPFQQHLQPAHRFLRPVIGDVILRKSLSQALSRLKEIYEIQKSDRLDPFDTFSWLMDESEKNNIRSHFYFKSGRKTDFDEGYKLRHPLIQKKLEEIHRRGHVIGFHPGYYTYQNASEWNSQLHELQSVSPQALKTGRQHYLRFEAPTTWRLWERAGFELDATLGYADHIGFRSGTCFEHPLFDLQERVQLKLRELPLMVMDCTLLGTAYMGIASHEKAISVGLQVKETCRKFSGVFSLLWHNSYLIKPGYKEVYASLIADAASANVGEFESSLPTESSHQGN